MTEARPTLNAILALDHQRALEVLLAQPVEYARDISIPEFSNSTKRSDTRLYFSGVYSFDIYHSIF